MAQGRGQICLLPQRKGPYCKRFLRHLAVPPFFLQPVFPHPAVGSADPPHNRPEHPARGLLASLDAGLQMLLVRRTLGGVPDESSM